MPNARTYISLLARRANVDHHTLAFREVGVDIMWPMPPSQGGVKFALIVVDYFTKWVQAETLSTIMASNITKFI